MQAASVSDFASFEAFQAAMRALPLTFTLDPVPSVKLKTLRGKTVSFTYGKTPVLDGKPVNYAAWKLFESPHLNAEMHSRRR